MGRHVPPEQIEPLNESYGMPGYLQTEWEPEDVHASIIDFVFRDDAHYEQCARLSGTDGAQQATRQSGGRPLLQGQG